MRTFILSDVEEKNIDEWIKEHTKHCPRLIQRSRSAIEVGYSVVFTQTSIGTVKDVACRCGQTKDITDYDGF
jgi:hypothetical protein